ncbi:hypothetical protein [Streptomyces sp. NPDC046261]|uniref:hypothetical protein n=1 Tax=Streptomyces sp. NPDC046261 TaxID=3157200 RepID=UPI0033C70792
MAITHSHPLPQTPEHHRSDDPGHIGSLEVVTPLRCKYIARLEIERREAVEAGRTNAAHVLTGAMCRHLRVMHP